MMNEITVGFNFVEKNIQILVFDGRISVFEKQTVVAQAFQPAGSGDFPVARLGHGTGMSREPADRNVCATKTEMRPWVLATSKNHE